MDTSGNSKTANCTAESETFLNCTTNYYSSTEPELVLIKSPESSVTWINTEPNSPLTTKLKSADILYFDESEKKWYFNLTLNIDANNWKLYLDILYGGKPSIANCLGVKRTLNCFVNEENQNKKTLIQLTDEVTEEANVKFTNLIMYEEIPLWTELTFDKAGKVKHNHYFTWYFSLFVKNDDIPEHSYIILDMKTYEKNPKYSFDYDFFSLADCYYISQVLKCTYYGYWHESFKIVVEKVKGSSSTVKKWNNVNGEYIYLDLEANLDYNYAAKIINDSEGKYSLNISILTNVSIYSRSSIDILIGNKPDIVYCFALNYYLLNCELEENKYNTNDKIYISKDKTSSSSITWNNLKENQPLFLMQLDFIHSYYLQSTINNYKNLDINIIAFGEGLKPNLILPIKFRIEKGKKTNNQNYQKFEEIIPCTYNYGIIFCSLENINKDTDESFIINAENNNTLEWNNPEKFSYDQTNYYTLTYKSLLYCFYDFDKKYYVYSLKNENNVKKGQYFVMDLFINNINSYGLCLNKENADGVIECHTQIIEKNDNDEIVIKNGRIYGNTQLNGFSDNIIYPNNLEVVGVSKVYDLQFNENKWEFKIKTSNNFKLNGIKTLDILIDNKASMADCVDTDDIILCKVNDAVQKDTQLIKLTETYSSSDNKIILANLNKYGIPLLSKFKFIDSSDIKYNKGWSFILKVKKVIDNFNIPSGSVFTIDINYNSNKEDLALCSESKRQNSELTLLCIPQSDIPKKDLITLSISEKSRYASISFDPAITEKNKYIFFNLDLYVESITMIKYDQTDKNYKFSMKVKEADILINSRILIDLKHKDTNSTAVCILKEVNKFECIPNDTSKDINEIISIWPIRIKGTVNLSPPEKLKFEYIFNFVKAYNLKYDSKWTFDILLSESKVKNGFSCSVGILVDDEDANANCIYNESILNCVVNYKNQDKFNIIKIKKDQNNNDKITWKNLNETINLYLAYEIKFINANGGFIGDKWRFNIFYELPDKNINTKMYNTYVLLDIVVSNYKQSTAICEITYSSYLKCISNHERQGEWNTIQIGVNKDPILGTVTFDKVIPEPQNEIRPANISLDYVSNLGYFNEKNYFEIIIEGTVLYSMEYDLEEDSVTKILLYHYYNSKYIKYDIACLTNHIKKKRGSYIYLICPTEISMIFDEVKIIVDNKKRSNNVEFYYNKNIKINVIKN